MEYFDRVDIIEAYAVYYWHWHSGALSERDWHKFSRTGKREATNVQLHRIGFRARPSLEYATLTDNGKAIYESLVAKYEKGN